MLVAQMSFRRETSGGVEKCRPFSQARKITNFVIVYLPNSDCNHANHVRVLWRVLSNYLGMMCTVLFNCPIKAEIWAVDSQSDLRILFCYSYDYRPNWTPLSSITIIYQKHCIYNRQYDTYLEFITQRWTQENGVT